MIKRTLFLLFSVLFIVGVSMGQNVEDDEKKAEKAKKKEARAAKRADKIAKGKFMMFPIAAPGYTPELGGLFTVGGLMSFKTNPSDDKIQRSSFPFTVGYTTTGAFITNGILNSFWLGDKLRINGDFWYKDMPDHYWGTGYLNGENVVKSDSTTAYNRQWWWINPRFLYQFRDDWFLGLNVDYNYTKGSEASEGVSNDEIYKEFKDKPLNSGLGAIVRFDSRDIPVDGRSGVLVDFRATFYTPGLGGDNKYQIYLLDYRQFKTVSREGMTLAWQIKSRVGIGDVPYGEMGQLGTPFDLRGYTWGRFRDESMFFFLGEYRHTFLDHAGELGKHGAVVWIGSGTVFNGETLDKNDNKWLPNFGLGYRFEVQPRMNIRLDYGVGRETSGIYFNFNQAF